MFNFATSIDDLKPNMRVTPSENVIPREVRCDTNDAFKDDAPSDDPRGRHNEDNVLPFTGKMRTPESSKEEPLGDLSDDTRQPSEESEIDPKQSEIQEDEKSIFLYTLENPGIILEPKDTPVSEPEQETTETASQFKPSMLVVEYIRRGWNPVAYKDKKPTRGKGWQNLPNVTIADVATLFPERRQWNVGVQLGPKSGDLVDIDLDCPEALCTAGTFFPPAAAIFGRSSSPNSHALYYSPELVSLGKAEIQFKDPDAVGGEKGMLLELRCGGGDKGAQSVFPGSTHKTGENITWTTFGEPLTVPGKTLFIAGEKCAAACLLVRGFPQGSKHDAALIIAGFLVRLGWSEDEITSFLNIILTAAGANPAAVRCVAPAIEKFQKGEPLAGFPRLKELYGEKRAAKIAEWLKYDFKKSSSQDEKAETSDWSEGVIQWGHSGCFERFLSHDGPILAEEHIEIAKSIVGRVNAEATPVLSHFYRCPSTCEPGDPKTAFFRGLSGSVPFVGWLYVNSQQPLPRGVGNILSNGISTFQSIQWLESQHFNLSVALHHFGSSIYQYLPGRILHFKMSVCGSPRARGRGRGHVWGLATASFKPSVTGIECGYACHTSVAARDYSFHVIPREVSAPG